MTLSISRRHFLSVSAGLAATAGLSSISSTLLAADPPKAGPLFQISLAQWSLHRTYFAKSADPIDFPVLAKKEYGIDGVEYVNQFFKDKAEDTKYLGELKKRCEDNGVTSVLIMIDDEGNLGDPDEKKRLQAVDNHKKWVAAAKFLGCHSIRVNARSSGSYWEQMKLAADGLRKLSEFGATHGIGIIVENHGGISSNGTWLSSTIHSVNHPNCGTLPDFGNFAVTRKVTYDKYKGVEELMPFAKGVSAKSHVFNEAGDEAEIDFRRMMKIVLSYNYHGWVGIEYEGTKHTEPEGIRFTKNLLEKVRTELT